MYTPFYRNAWGYGNPAYGYGYPSWGYGGIGAGWGNWGYGNNVVGSAIANQNVINTGTATGIVQTATPTVIW